MSSTARHAYRFGFLKSDKWKAVRMAALVKAGAACYVCGKVDIHNDAHHVNYRRNWNDTKVQDLVILCRKHHEVVHTMMKKHRSMSKKAIVEMVKTDIQSFFSVVHRCRKSGLGMERYMQRQAMFQSVWMNGVHRKMLTVGRHRIESPTITAVSTGT